MNASPYFRYYAAFVLILLLALMLRVQAHPAPKAPATAQVALGARLAGQLAAR